MADSGYTITDSGANDLKVWNSGNGLTAQQEDEAIKKAHDMPSASEVDLVSTKSKYFQRIISKAQAGNKKIGWIGDSISQSFTDKDPLNTNVFSLVRRALMANLKKDNQGFVDITSKFNWSSGMVGTWDINELVSNSWTGNTYTTEDSDARYFWFLNDNQSVNRYFQFGYLTDTSPIEFEVYVNGILVETITESADTERTQKFSQVYDFEDYVWADGYNKVNINHTSGKLSLTGTRQFNDSASIIIDNCSKGGRKTLDTSAKLIEEYCQYYDVIFWALGPNDSGLSGLTEAEELTVLDRLNDLKTYAIANNVPIIFLDFIWMQEETHYYRARIKELAEEIPDSKIISFPNLLKFDGSITTDVERDAMGFTLDGVHPTPQGDRWLATHIFNEIGLDPSWEYSFDSDLVYLPDAEEYYRKARYFGNSDGLPSVNNSNYFVDGDTYTDISTLPPQNKYYDFATTTWINY